MSRHRLTAEVRRILKHKGLTQRAAAHIAGVEPSEISLLLGGRTHGFSFERYVRVLTRLGHDVDIVVRRVRRGGKVRLKVK